MAEDKKSIRVQGAMRVDDNNPNAGNLEAFGIKTVTRVDLSAARGRDDKQSVPGVANDDVLELGLDGGAVLIVRRDDYEAQFQDPNRSSPGGSIEISSLRIGAPSRGFDEWVVKALDVFTGSAAKISAHLLCEKFESKSLDHPGLARVVATQTDPGFRLEAVKTASAATGKPLLVFIHGTASSTEGSFGQLLGNHEMRDRLFEEYDGRVYAFDHRTLTQSPFENTLELAGALPKNAILHLVSHSRGGLVGELLCRATKSRGEPFSDDEINAFVRLYESAVEAVDKDNREGVLTAYRKQEASLKKLNILLKNKKFKVGRFVRVACPARGTTLASGRLDRWFSVMSSLLGMIPVLKAAPYFGVLKAFVVALVRTRTDPRIIPGLEAQMPESPLIGLINTVTETLDADLTVISGDTEKTGMFGKLAMLAMDKFYDGHHDLVVNTASMYGGGRRTQMPRYFFDQGDVTSHFNYFTNVRTGTRVVDGLAGDETTLRERFTCNLPELLRPIARAAVTHSGPRPVIYLLPGILGSELAVKDKTIWVDALQLVNGGLAKLSIDKERISPCGVVESSYQKLINFLSQEYEVIPFHYDWRLPLTTEAKRLAQSITNSIDRNQGNGLPVSIIAHSMGGLVVRAMIASHREVWNRLIEHDQGRFIMLGTPNGGSYSIPRMMVGQDKLIKMLALADIRNSNADILDIIRRFPGVLNLLPESDSGLDLFSAQSWEQIRSTDKNVESAPDKEDLDNARRVRDLLNTVVYSQEPAGKVLYVAGKAEVTPIAMSLNQGEARFSGTASGDGRVPWSSGIPHRVPVWYMDAVHGDLANETSGFAALKELVDSGATDLLSRIPPTVTRGVEDVFDLPADDIEYRPNEADIKNAALGATVGVVRPEKITPKVRIQVTHGNMVFARYPVAVGHYANDGIYSAEKVLNLRFDKRLSQRHTLDLYPGELNTCEVIYDPKRKPEGVIVVGLGEVGELNVSRLESTYSKALKEYMLVRHEYDRRVGKANGQDKLIGFSPLLIGGSSGGMASSDCLLAMLRGVLSANQRLEQEFPGESVITSIQIVELWEDVAHGILKTLRSLTRRNGRLDRIFVISDELERGTGGQYRVQYDEEKGWLQRIQIRETDDGDLAFNTITNRARIESRVLPNDRTKVDEFIHQATASTATNNTIPKTLFEMLLPNDFKSRASTQGDTILQLNEGSARYPWELLEDRWGQAEFPFSVNFKLIRQLESSYFTANPPSRRSNAALVVGAPSLGKRWAPLPGAVKEARLVTGALEAHPLFNPVSLIEQSGYKLLDSLHANSYRILHLAGHGVYEFDISAEEPEISQACKDNSDRKLQSGMVISDHMLLTPADIENMRYVPELVFINCCHLGYIEDDDQRDFHQQYKRDFPGIAANLATQFIRKGANAVVAAGWEVDDAAALTFARIFYDGMLDGMDFASAVRAARRETWHSHRNVNTWGAYQCYGNPDYVLCEQPAARGSSVMSYYSPMEMVSALKSLVSEAQSTQSDDNRVLDKVRSHETWLGAKKTAWQGEGELCATLAEAFKEGGDFGQAIKWYQKAIACDDAGCSLKSTEQLANLLARNALKQVLCPGATRKQVSTARADINQGIEYLLELLNMFGDANSATQERLSLLGSAYRCKALLEVCVSRVDSKRLRNAVLRSLKEMEHYYYAASWLGQGAVITVARDKIHVDIKWTEGSNRTPNPYPFLNYMMARFLKYQLTQDRQPAMDAGAGEDMKMLSMLERQYEIDESRKPDFWTLVAAADGKLTRDLLLGELADSIEQVKAYYDRAYLRGVSEVQKDSVIKTLNGIALLSDPQTIKVPGKQTLRRANHELLQEIIKHLIGDKE